MNEDRATRYHRLRRRAAMLVAVWRAALLAAAFASGASQALSDALGSALQPVPPPFRLPSVVLAFVAVAAVVYGLGALPMSFFAGFTLERRYGLSRQPAGSWLRDHLKAGALHLAFTGTAAAWMYVCLTAVPALWWLPAWAGVTAAGVVTAWAAPVLLLPLFCRYQPLTDTALRDRLLALAARAGMPALGVFEWITNGRTSRAGAALTGLGRTRRIVISDTLLSGCEPDELEAVLAHEVAHHATHDIWQGLAVSAAVSLGAFVAADAALRAVVGVAWLPGLADPAGLPVAGLAMMAVTWAASPLQHAVSRAHERRADRTALDLTRNVGAFVSALRRVGARNLAEPAPSRLTTILFHTHPPIDERIDLAAAWARERQPLAGAAPGSASVRDDGA